MRTSSLRVLAGIAAAALLAAPAAAGEPGAALNALMTFPAVSSPAAANGMVLAAATAGGRVVAVGERGLVLLSDDAGRSFRQARSVPTQATLTAVAFATPAKGWAVGHWGTVLATADGGETWVRQRMDAAQDRPLFSVHFRNEREGLAVGLWSLLLTTGDGGATWTEAELPPPPGADKADLNLFGITVSGPDLLVTGEQGKILRSPDGGRSWSYIDTGYAGSLWTGTALRDGTLLAGGLRGTILRSVDGGTTWAPSETGTRSSVTGIAQLDDGTIVASALDGVALSSQDGGRRFVARQRDDRLPLTGVIATGGKPLFLSKAGPLPDAVAAGR